MKKYILDLEIVENRTLGNGLFLLRLTDKNALPEMVPGQFVEVKVEGGDGILLRRPISINYVDRNNNELWLLVQIAGRGTEMLSHVKAGGTVNVVLPLGNGFTMPAADENCILIGGGVGIAPLLYMGEEMKRRGCKVTFLLGARAKALLSELELFKAVGEVYVTTEDGSEGEKGFVTNHSILKETKFDRIYTCGPSPMMKAVVKYARENGIDCEVSLENRMACGVGACLCCVENTTEGHVCVCKEGPVLNAERLLWQI